MYGMQESQSEAHQEVQTSSAEITKLRATVACMHAAVGSVFISLIGFPFVVDKVPKALTATRIVLQLF